MVSGRNQEVCPWSDLIYYNPARSARDSSTVSSGPRAIGSRRETGEMTSDEIPGAAAATANDADRAEDAVEPSVVPSEAVEAELDARLGQSIEALTGYTPEKRAEGESRHDYEVRLRSWVTTIENPSLKSHAKVLAEGLLEGANRLDDLWEAFTCAKEKRKKLAQGAKDQEKKDSEALQNEALRNFDLTSLLVAHQKESTTFYRGIAKILYDLKELVTSPANTMGEFGTKIESVIADVGNITTSCNSMVVRSGSAIEQLGLQLKDISWHLSPKSVDRRCLPERDQNSRTVWRESTREIMLASRFKLRDICDELEKLVQRMDRQINASGALNALLTLLEQSVQIQVETRDLMKAMVENQKALMELPKKQDVEKEAKKKAAQKAAEAEASKNRKELEEAREMAEIAAKKARALEEEIKTSPLKNRLSFLLPFFLRPP